MNVSRQQSSEEFNEFLDGLITENVAAKELRVKPQTLMQWRALKKGPPFFKVGRRCFYTRRHNRAWIAEQMRNPGARTRQERSRAQQ